MVDGIAVLNFVKLFEALEGFRGLQRKEWELNQTGADRGMEAVLIQRSSREVATYALTRLRLESMPELLTQYGNTKLSLPEVQQLCEWGTTQGAGGSMLSEVVRRELNHPAQSSRMLAALASLKYYRCRDDQNPAVKSPWNEDGSKHLLSIETNMLLEYPTQGKFWNRKFETVRRLVSYVITKRFHHADDTTVIKQLKSIQNVGEQTSSMVALFWLNRPVPIIDDYLIRLLRDHDYLGSSSMGTKDRADLRSRLLQGALDIEARRPEWSASRVLSCLYLWVCETMRLYCACRKEPSSSCPIRAIR